MRRELLLAATMAASVTTWAAGCGPRPPASDGGTDAAAVTDSGPLFPLSLATIIPPGSYVSGGATVDLTGSGFVDGIEIRFDGALCLNLQVEFNGVANCIVPPAPNGPGVVDVVVTRPEDGATATLKDGFQYVLPPGQPIAWCNLQFPAAIATAPGGVTETIFGRLFVAGVTTGAGQGFGVTGQVGFGPAGTAPDLTGGTWTWSAATFANDVDGLMMGDLANDEFGATITAPGAAGTFDYAYAFSTDGATWTMCDLDGNDIGGGGSNGYDSSQAGVLTVSGPSTLPGWCNLQFPPSLVTVAGWPSAHAYGRVFAAGITDLAGPGAGLLAELGFGPDGTAPGAGWTFAGAPYNVDTDAGANDEYWATVTAPLAGTFDLAWRFSIDAGTSWLSCDLDGNDGSAGGYDPAMAGALVVEAPAGGTPDWCNLQFPPTLMVSAGAASGAVYGWIYRIGLTDVAGRASGVIGEIGFGPDGSDPSIDATGWTFEGAAYNTDTGPVPMPLANDEYQGAVIVPPGTAAGSYDYAARFSLDGGATFRYCDLDGNDGAANLYDPAQAGDLTVP